jgi:isocitrate/isopropylmalate dehydrogenase
VKNVFKDTSWEMREDRRYVLGEAFSMALKNHCRENTRVSSLDKNNVLTFIVINYIHYM